MALTSLPNELLDAICNAFEDRRDLHAFSMASSALYTIALRALYRNISITADPKSIRVATLLEHNPHLARRVRSFAVVVPQSYKPSMASYKSLSNALALMRDLESLKLTIDPAMSWVLPNSSELRFPRLRNFTCVFSLDHNVTQFLSKTRALVHLELGHDLQTGPDVSELPSSYIPHLSSFAGSSQAALAIVPGRPVSSISMHSGDLTDDVVHALANSTASVLFLDATTASLPLPLLDAMAVAIPELQELRLATTYNLWDEWFNTPFIQNIKNALVSMNNLKTAEVSGMLWRWHDKEGRVLANEPQVLPDVPGDDDTSYFHT